MMHDQVDGAGGGAPKRPVSRRVAALRYATLFLALAVFSVTSLGYARPETAIDQLASMMNDGSESTVFLLLKGGVFGGAVLSGKDLVCQITEDQADRLTRALETRTRRYALDSKVIRVVEVRDDRDNHLVVKAILGDRLEDPERTHVVEPDRLVPLLMPNFVS